MRSFTDDAGHLWQVTIGKESWGTLVLLFSPASGGDARTSILDAETMLRANAELDALSEDALRARLRDSRPWS
jgi:hypothetical protein